MTALVISPSRANPKQSPSPLQRLVNRETQEIVQRAAALHNPVSPASLRSGSPGMKPLEEQLFEALVNVKILTSQVAMHFDREWRSKLFHQLDSLHDQAEWEPGDQPVRHDSFATFLKAALDISPQRRPGLGLSNTGNLITTWTTGQDRLTIEFMPQDRVRWVLSRYDDEGQPDRFAGEVDVSRLSESLSFYKPEHWFAHVKKNFAST